MVLPTVRDVFSENFLSVTENDLLSKCFSLFEKKRIPALVVLDEKGRYKGVITRKWILRLRGDPSKTKAKKLLRSAPILELDTSLSEAARLMIESGIMQLPVRNKGSILGFISDQAVIQFVVTKRWGDMKVEQIMTENPVVVEEGDTLGSVLSLFRREGFSHAPVVKRGRVVGMISVHDFIHHIFQPKHRESLGEVVGESIPVLNTPVKGIMSEPVITVSLHTVLREAVNKMHDFNVSCLVAVKGQKALGIITNQDFLEPIAQMEMKQRKLTLQISTKDVEMDPIKKRLLINDYDAFTRKYQQVLESGTLFVYLKTHNRGYKGKKLSHCRLQLRTVKGSFFSAAEDFGIEEVFRTALTRLERQVLRSKELEDNPESAQKYLQSIKSS